MLVTRDLMKDARTLNGSYSAAQVTLAKALTKTGDWKRELTGRNVTVLWWQEFYSLRLVTKRNKVKKNKPKVINPMATTHSDSWKPEPKDIPQPKKVGGNKAKRQAVSGMMNKEFYLSDAWRAIRMRVIEKYEAKCMACGKSPKDHGIVIHVDHIKPRSKHPELSLVFDNLQLLCEGCNIGKSNKYETDWRSRPLANF